ncbi:MAG: PspC domain-containing protein [Bacteroidales bacterium]|nr:PspC domain-containing protein [Bacteroidales bacterium]
MKKTINVAIGGCSFTIDDDAYNTLSNYLDRFKAALDNSSTSSDVMDELEVRIADLLKGKLGSREVVDMKMAQDVIGALGYPEGYKEAESQSDGASGEATGSQDGPDCSRCNERPVRKLFRDPDDKKIAGVCSGLALFLGVDVVLIRIIFLVALLCGSAGGWIYLVIWIAAPEARTAAEKCELRGIPATAENIRRFTEGR